MKFLKRLKQEWNNMINEAVRQSYYQANWVPAAITAGGALLSAIFGSKAKAKGEERLLEKQYEYGKQSAEDRIARADAAGLKPQTPRHEYWSGLSQIAPFLQNAIMGSFADIFGQDTLAKWGSNYNPMGAGGNQGVTPPEMQLPPGPSGQPQGGGGRPMPPWMEDRNREMM